MTRHRHCITVLTTVALAATSSIANADPVHHFDISSYHGCTANDCGTLWCWGGEESVFGGDKGVHYTGTPSWPFQVGAGDRHSCVNLRDVNGPSGGNARGFIDCWGRNDYGQIDVPPEHEWRQLAVGMDHNCATDWTNKVVCWGRDDAGQVSEAPAGRTFATLGLAAKQSCGVTRVFVNGRVVDGDEIRCWGEPAGKIEVVHRTDLPFAPSGERFTKVSAGAVHTCALTNFGKVYCWGDNTSSVLSPSFQGQPTGLSFPIEGGGTMQQVPAGRTYLDVAAGELGTCAVYDDNFSGERGVECWGYPFSFDQSLWTIMTSGGLESTEVPLEGFEPEQVQLTLNEVCALDVDDGELRCWSTTNGVWWSCEPQSDPHCCDSFEKSCCDPATDASCCDPNTDPLCRDHRSWDLLPDVDPYACV
ncbi:MAG: hypothetical protein K1X88_01300 [Nannocystaceae bacterium]|nr:hypothetical protein [Nannocystaceae bacterium]